MKKTDIVVIGTGIAGITAAIYLKLSGGNFILVGDDDVGGLLKKLSKIENYPAYNSITGQELINGLKSQLEHQEIDIFKANVQTILKDKEGFDVVTDVESIKAKSVIIATGNNITSSLIKGEDKYLGSGVSYCATCDGNFFKGMPVAVVGNNNVALEEALYLSNLVSELHLYIKENILLGDEELINKITSKNNIIIHSNSEVNEISGDALGVNSIISNGESTEVYGVFIYSGKKTTSQILNNLNPLKNGPFIVVNDENMTNISGLYASGDVVSKNLKQLITAAGDGANAASSALLYCEL